MSAGSVGLLLSSSKVVSPVGLRNIEPLLIDMNFIVAAGKNESLLT